MTLRHLTVFVAVVDNDCNITKAAAALNIAQPSVSQTISELEDYYGHLLFNRLNRRLYLTPLGSATYPKALQILESFKHLEEHLYNPTLLPLKIGASLTVATSYLPAQLSRFSQTFSRPLELSVFNTQIIEEALLHNKLDCAIVEGEVRSHDLVQIPVAEDRIVLVCTPTYYEETKNLTTDTTLVLREKGSGTRQLSLELLPQFGLPTARIWEISNTQTIIEMVKNHLGFTLISNQLIQSELQEGSLIEPQPTISLKRNYRLIYHKDKPIDPQIQFFNHP